MMAAWIAKGAEIGVTAFFSLFVFALCMGVLAGVIALFGMLFGAGDGDRR